MMSQPDAHRRLYLPPRGRPRWKAQASLEWDLLYLFWGQRWYGDHPIPLSCRDGWTYLIILDGAPTFFFKNGTERKGYPGLGFVFHPDCMRGVSDEAGRHCSILGWIWRTQPNHVRIQPRPGADFQTSFSQDQRHQLEKIHAACRREVAEPGSYSPLALQKAKLELDLCCLHSLDKPEPANQESRVALAKAYIRHNPNVLDPVRKICEYLQVSPATLKRLFARYVGQSPQAFALEQRMLLARDLLSTGEQMVKEVAFKLGYKHPNDFSRAYHRFFRNEP